MNFCTYCIIPYTRGRLRSLPIEAIQRHCEKLAAEGYLELVLTGIEIASYGVDLDGKPNLADAICGRPRQRPGCGSGWVLWSPRW